MVAAVSASAIHRDKQQSGAMERWRVGAIMRRQQSRSPGAIAKWWFRRLPRAIWECRICWIHSTQIYQMTSKPADRANDPTDGSGVPKLPSIAGRTEEVETPDWLNWQRRPNVGVGDGVLLARNIHPAKGVRKRLRRAGDPRGKQVDSDKRTASLSMETDPRLMPITPPLKERQSDRLRQKVRLADFAAWAVEILDPTNMTDEFRALARVSPRQVDTTTVDGNPERDRHSLQTDAKRAGQSSLALGLLAMYVRQLAMNKQAPPNTLLKGSKPRINFSKLAKLIQEFAENRTDQKSPNAGSMSGASIVTLRRELAAAAMCFSDDFDQVGDGETVDGT